MASLKKEEWSCYRGRFNGRKNGHVTEVVTLMEGEWSCYRGGHFNGGRMVVTEVVFNGGSMIMLQRSIMEREWPCGQFK